jgi:hypothetical protein
MNGFYSFITHSAITNRSMKRWDTSNYMGQDSHAVLSAAQTHASTATLIAKYTPDFSGAPGVKHTNSAAKPLVIAENHTGNSQKPQSDHSNATKYTAKSLAAGHVQPQSSQATPPGHNATVGSQLHQLCEHPEYPHWLPYPKSTCPKHVQTTAWQQSRGLGVQVRIVTPWFKP